MRAVVVDDEARIRRGVERLILSCGDDWKVVGNFSSAMQCLEVVKETNLEFDVLITDIKMPVMNGLTLIKKLKKLQSFYSVVISGFDDLEFLQTAIREGASDYLMKPIDRDEFRNLLKNLKKKKIEQMSRIQRINEFKIKASQLNYMKQTQKLSEVTQQQDLDLSLLGWTKQFPQSNYQLIYVCADNMISKSKKFEKKDWKTWSFVIENIIEEMVEKYRTNTSFEVWKWRGEELSFWILIQQDDLHDHQGIEFSMEMKRNIQTYTPLSCSFAVGRSFKDLTLLSSQRDKLLTYIQYRVLYGGNQIFSKELIDENKKRQNAEANKYKQKHLKNAIDRIVFFLDSRNSSNVLSAIDQFLYTLQKKDQPKEIEQSIKILGVRIINDLMENGVLADYFVLIQEIFTIPAKTSNFNELRNAVYDWSKKVLERLKTTSDSLPQGTEPIAVAKNWIENNLDQKITIPKIASQVFMNPTYFCEYFKKYTGETILDYVTRTRIRKAHELLLNSDLKIYHISAQVGYTDAKYFSQLFREFYGETPSKYRQKKILKQM